MTHFLAEMYWPSDAKVIVRAMNGRECVTAAAGDCPWDAAWRCCRFVLARTRKDAA